MEWIEVTDRLPNNTENVLVVAHYDGEPVIEVAWYEGGEHLWRTPYYEEDDPENVTHWMPLPELPEE